MAKQSTYNFLDLVGQHKPMKKEIGTAIRRVLESGQFIGGEEVEKFEKEIAKFCGVKYAIGVNSGTDALFLSLKALGISREDEVITSPFTFIATAETIINSGAKPVFVDIDPQTFNIDSEKIEKAITKKTKAIIPVHLFGQMTSMDKIKKIAKKYKLYIVEDVAQAIGATFQGKKAGSIGDLGCFSFFPAKNLGACGDAGMIVTNSKSLNNKIRMLRNHGSSAKNKYLNLIPGFNSRLDAIQAAILRVKLKHLKKWNEKRKENALYYNIFLKGIDDIAVPFIAKHQTHIFHQYTIKVKDRDNIQKHLREKGILTMIYYPLPLHLQPAFKYLGYEKGDFPEAEKAAREVLSLPIYPEIFREKQNFIIEKIHEILGT